MDKAVASFQHDQFKNSVNCEQISVIVTCYKEGDLLLRAVRSLDAQTDQGFSVIVVNDNSLCHRTIEICSDIEKKERFKVIWRKQNGGLSSARNSGFDAAKPGICVVLDADDELPHDAIATIRAAFARSPEADFIFGDYIKVNVESSQRERIDCSNLADESRWLVPKNVLERWTMLGHSPCKKHVWEKVRGYRQEFSYGYQDVDFWMRAMAKGFRGAYVNEIIYHWWRSEEGMNARREGRNRFYQAKSLKYYEILGEQYDLWERLVLYYLDNRTNPAIRKEAREVWCALFPHKWNRISQFVKYSMLLLPPMLVSEKLLALKKKLKCVTKLCV